MIIKMCLIEKCDATKSGETFTFTTGSASMFLSVIHNVGSFDFIILKKYQRIFPSVTKSVLDRLPQKR